MVTEIPCKNSKGVVVAIAMVDEGTLAPYLKWTYNPITGYVYTAGPRPKRRPIYLHQFIFGRAPKGFVIDHKNRNPLDCRLSNLGLLERAQNSFRRYREVTQTI